MCRNENVDKIAAQPPLEIAKPRDKLVTKN